MAYQQGREALRQILENGRDKVVMKLRNKVRDIRERTTEELTFSSGDEIDEVNQDTAKDVDFALINLNNSTIRAYDEALERLSQGKYDNCSDCGKLIDLKRLKVIPFATRCKSCQEACEIESSHLTKQHHWHMPSFMLTDELHRE